VLKAGSSCKSIEPQEGTVETPSIQTREWIIQEILKIRQSGVFPSLAHVEKNHPDLRDAAKGEFRGWEWALVAAKVIVPPFDPDMFFDHELCVWAHDSLTVPLDRLYPDPLSSKYGVRPTNNSFDKSRRWSSAKTSNRTIN
jgi:hypothetical protein